MSMKDFTVGQVLAASDVNEYCVNTHFAYKASDTSRTSSPGLSNDPDLQLAVEANVIYELWCEVVFNSSTAQLAVQFGGPSGMTLGGTVWCRSSGATQSATMTIMTALSIYADGGASTACVTMHGLVNTAGTAGTLAVQWGQGTSSANATVVKAGSMLSLRRVA